MEHRSHSKTRATCQVSCGAFRVDPLRHLLRQGLLRAPPRHPPQAPWWEPGGSPLRHVESIMRPDDDFTPETFCGSQGCLLARPVSFLLWAPRSTPFSRLPHGIWGHGPGSDSRDAGRSYAWAPQDWALSLPQDLSCYLVPLPLALCRGPQGPGNGRTSGWRRLGGPPPPQPGPITDSHWARVRVRRNSASGRP